MMTIAQVFADTGGFDHMSGFGWGMMGFGWIMGLLIIGVFLWIVVHLMPAIAPSIKESLVGGMGAKPYRGVFALLIFSAYCVEAVTTIVWEQNSQGEFSKGKPTDVSISSENEISLSRALIPVEGDMSELEEKPHAPPSSTRMPNPSDSVTEPVSISPFFMTRSSVVVRTRLASA